MSPIHDSELHILCPLEQCAAGFTIEPWPVWDHGPGTLDHVNMPVCDGLLYTAAMLGTMQGI